MLCNLEAVLTTHRKVLTMDIVLLIFGFILMLIGILGSLLPVLPGPPVSWVGLLLLIFTRAVPDDWWFLAITGVVALVVFAMDYLIPAIGARKFGGSRAGDDRYYNRPGYRYCISSFRIFWDHNLAFYWGACWRNN